MGFSLATMKTDYRRGPGTKYGPRSYRNRYDYRNKPGYKNLNKPVINKLRRKVAPTKTGRNQNAIMTLSRQVKKLERTQFGSKQFQMQSFSLPTMYAPDSAHPLGFMANSFYAKDEQGGTQVYYGSVDPVTKDPVVTTVDQFEKATFSALADLNPQFEWNEYNNANQVSAIRYLPVAAVYSFRISSSLLQPALPHRYRITFLKIKPTEVIVNSSARSNSTLPNTLGAYWHMVENDVESRNYFNPKYHKILHDKFIVIKPPTGAATESKVYVAKRKFKINLGNKLMTPNFLNQTDVPNQNMWTNTPIGDQIWCIISSAQGPSNGAQIQCTRHLVWRDPHGVST